MKIYAKTDIGKVRNINQDHFDFQIFDHKFSWAAVCDGMGGTKAGEVASTLACQSVKKAIREKFKVDLSEEEVKAIILDSIKISNAKILQKSAENEEYLGMGTTIVLVAIHNNIAHVAHIGDSRAYVISEGKIEQITKDHSMVQEMIESGEITSEQAKNHPKKNIITRALGVHEDIEIDYASVALKKDDTLLLCTDGLSNYIDDEEVLRYVEKYSGQEVVDNLVQKANDLGGNDNLTALIMEI
ncbi:MAG: Stp1/IreP family PP2C-type Ser/Thr phosphatase [Clostridia bacterium]|nr:Stp1/IreP family PP2C-type Ser/Thr phosphatase [Clostridia bacterium]